MNAAALDAYAPLMTTPWIANLHHNQSANPNCTFYCKQPPTPNKTSFAKILLSAALAKLESVRKLHTNRPDYLKTLGNIREADGILNDTRESWVEGIYCF